MGATGSVTLREAVLDDLELLQRWAAEPHVNEGVPVNAWDFEGDLRETSEFRYPLIAELDGRPIGFMQLLDAAKEETHYWGNIEPGTWAIDIWIGEPDCIGRGYGSRMMRMAIDKCFDDHHATAIVIDPMADNTRAHRFYERLGFVFQERRNFDDDDCFVYRLTGRESKAD